MLLIARLHNSSVILCGQSSLISHTRLSMLLENVLVEYDQQPEYLKCPRTILRNFCFMAFSFSILHGTVTAELAVASAFLGPDLGGLQSGVLYVCYTLSALVLAAGIVQKLGPKTTLVIFISWSPSLFMTC
jgi:hypothetical protein